MLGRKILVTGGAGFIGSHSVDLLLAENYQVVVLDNLSSGKLTNLPLNHPELVFIEGDVLEYPLVEELLTDCDAVLHCAAIPSVPLSLQEPMYCFQVNMQGFLHILVAIERLQMRIPVIYASSAAVYGDSKTLPCRDDQPLTSIPISPYALQKINNEEYACLYHRLFGIQSLGLRYFNVYGERQDAQSPYSGVISLFANALRNDQSVTVFGDGTQSRDFIHVSDIAAANLRALQFFASRETDIEATALNIATGKAQTLLQLIGYMEDATGKKAQLQFQPAREGDIKHSYAAVENAKTVLGFEAKVDLQTGIQLLMTNLQVI